MIDGNMLGKNPRRKHECKPKEKTEFSHRVKRGRVRRRKNFFFNISIIDQSTMSNQQSTNDL